jgi:hypothetical protein
VAARKASAERLIDQQLIRDELATGGYSRATDTDAQTMLRQIRQRLYADSGPKMQGALRTYGLAEEQLQAQLLWQLTVLRFIDQRFRTAVLVTDDDVRNYYDQHRAQFKGAFETVAAEIRSALEGEQINQQFEKWLQGARSRGRIEYRPEALQ